MACLRAHHAACSRFTCVCVCVCVCEREYTHINIYPNTNIYRAFDQWAIPCIKLTSVFFTAEKLYEASEMVQQCIREIAPFHITLSKLRVVQHSSEASLWMEPGLLYIYIYVSMHMMIHACMYVCIYVCMHISMYVCVYICIHII